MCQYGGFTIDLIQNILSRTCYPFSDGYAQVIEQSYGVWHTKCFPKPREPTPEDIIEICQKVGYRDVHHARSRIILETSKATYLHISNGVSIFQFSLTASIPDATTLRSRAEDGSIVTGDGAYSSDGPIKAEIINQFAAAVLRPELQVIFKPSRPIARPQKWVQSDEETCYRVEVLCE